MKNANKTAYGSIGGLTKREYFAAMAMQGIMVGSDFSCKPTDAAIYAIDFADALLSELEKSNEQ